MAVIAALALALVTATAPDAPLADPPDGGALVPVEASAAAGPSALAEPVPQRLTSMNLLVPLLESEILHLGFLAFSNLVTREPFAAISWDSITSHFDGRRPWTWDVDYFITNQFGHPYQGALSFTAARAAGVPFWLACLYPLVGSMTWELLYEVDAPSINDQITTTFGGIFLGEVLHRAARLVIHATPNGTPPSWARHLGAFLLSPMDSVNGWLFDEQLNSGEVDEHPPYFAQLAAGANFGTVLRDPLTQQPYLSAAVQLNLQGRLTYGLPGDPAMRSQVPFSHFDIDVNLSTLGGTTSGSYFSRGLLLGTTFGGLTSSVRGVWGLFGQYDYSGVSLVRVSAVGVGVGTSLQWTLGKHLFLQASGVLSGVPFSTAGSLGLDEELYRDYHIGPGAQATLEVRLIHRSVGWLRLVARNWFVVGAYTPPSGWESIAYLTFGPLVRVIGPLALGLDIVLAVRRSHFEDDTFNRAVTGFTSRVTLSWLSDWQFGVIERRPVSPNGQ